MQISTFINFLWSVNLMGEFRQNIDLFDIRVNQKAVRTLGSYCVCVIIIHLYHKAAGTNNCISYRVALQS